MPGEHRTRKVASSPASCQNFSCNFLSRSCCVLGEYVQVHVSVHSAGRCHTHTACMRIQIGLCSPGLCVNECVICMSCVWLFVLCSGGGGARACVCACGVGVFCLPCMRVSVSHQGRMKKKAYGTCSQEASSIRREENQTHGGPRVKRGPGKVKSCAPARAGCWTCIGRLCSCPGPPPTR